jgi:DNA-binding PadR family transcriptional regulator
MPKGDSLGEFELCVMLALTHLKPHAYGMTIRQEIEVRTGRDLAIGSVYATLSRLEEKGLVRFDLSEPLPIQGGRARKFYSLTPAGERALSGTVSMLTSMLRGWTPRRKPNEA